MTDKELAIGLCRMHIADIKRNPHASAVVKECVKFVLENIITSLERGSKIGAMTDSKGNTITWEEINDR